MQSGAEHKIIISWFIVDRLSKYPDRRCEKDWTILISLYVIVRHWTLFSPSHSPFLSLSLTLTFYCLGFFRYLSVSNFGNRLFMLLLRRTINYALSFPNHVLMIRSRDIFLLSSPLEFFLVVWIRVRSIPRSCWDLYLDK